MEAMADNRCAPTEEGGERFVVKGRLLVVIKGSSSWWWLEAVVLDGGSRQWTGGSWLYFERAKRDDK